VTVLYCIDASSLLRAWNEAYPIDIFPTFWDKLEVLIAADRLVAPDLVRDECRDPDLLKWLKKRPAMFRRRDIDIQKGASSVLAAYPKLVALPKRNASADPFVIALARLTSATIITEEGLGSTGKPTIPFVVNDKNFSCPIANLLQLIRSERWVFQ
jgi:hypothetical protein